jgi:uncharacterized membrane protein
MPPALGETCRTSRPLSGETASPGDGRHLEPGEAEEVDAAVVDPHELRPHPNARRLDAVLKQSRYVSPLPSPDDLERYQRLVPDAAERLLSAGEREQAHRHEMNNRAASIDEEIVPAFFEGEKRSQNYSLTLGLGYEVVMLAAILAGYALEGIVGAALGIAAMIWAIRRDSDGGMPPQAPADASTDAAPARQSD